MSAYSLLYVSNSLIHGSAAKIAVDEIVEAARGRNVDLGVCGALLFTGTRFAQVLEGPRAGVEQLMSSIRRDDRHSAIVVIREGEIDRPRFRTWGLAYSGAAMFVGRTVDRALEDATAWPPQAKGEGLLQMLSEFAEA